MRAVIYCRVSSDTSNIGRSVTEQEAECRALCEREGWTVADVLVDNDRGASRYSRKDRPAYRKLQRVLQEGDALVTWEASRAQRDLAAYVQLRDLCVDRNVLWCYSGRIYDLSRGDDRFITGLDALLSEKEVEEIRNRVLRGVRANLAAGRPHGKLPYVYRILRDPVTGEPLERVPDEETAPIVREMARRTLAGEAMYSIVADLNARGISGPRPGRDGQPVLWLPAVARRMIENPTYAGLRTHRGEVTGPATWQGLITVDEHQRIKSIFADPKRRTNHRGSAPRWLLSGIAVCSVCGATVRRQKNRGYGTYSCVAGFCVSRVIEPTDALVVESVLRRLESVDVIEHLTEQDSVAADARVELEALRTRLDAFTDSAAAGEVSPAALARIEQRLRPQIVEAERRVRAAFSSPIVAELAGPHARTRWVELSLEDQRAVVKALATVRILKTRRRRTFDPASVEITWN
ncbi:recombinase family protein [Promicromonospora sukumoe]